MSKLIVFTNVIRHAHQRVGVGAKNQPEKRQYVIFDAIQKKFEECITFTSSSPIPYDWVSEIHKKEYLEFLESAYKSWQITKDPDWIENLDNSEQPGLVPHEFYRAKHSRLPLYKQSGYYGTDTMTPIYEDSYRNAMIAADKS